MTPPPPLVGVEPPPLPLSPTPPETKAVIYSLSIPTKPTLTSVFFFPFFFFLLPLPIKRVTDEVMEAVWPGSAGEKNECEAEAREMDG